MNKEELEFERINRKLDALFNIVIDLKNKFQDMDYDKEFKELEDKLKHSESDFEWHKENRRFMLEGRQWDRKSWDNIDDYYYRMKGEIKDDRCYPVERLDVEAPEVL